MFRDCRRSRQWRHAIAQTKVFRPDLVLMAFMCLLSTNWTRPGNHQNAAPIAGCDSDGFQRGQGSLGDQVRRLRLSLPEDRAGKIMRIILGVCAANQPLPAPRQRDFARIRREQSKTCEAADLRASQTRTEILKLLATGLTNKEIGARLSLAENPVKNHLKNILAKLHLQNRVPAATLAVQQGLHGGNSSTVAHRHFAPASS